MFGAIAGGIASALAGGAMSKLFGGGQKAASGGIQGDVLATDNNTVGMGDAGIKSAIQGSNVPNPDEAVPSFVSGAMAKAGKGLLEGTLQAGTSAVSDKLLDLVGLGGKSAADKGKDTRDYLAAAFPELNAWERAGADASSAGMVDAGLKWFLENEKTVTQFCRKLAAERPLKDIRDEYNYPKKKGIKDECSRLLEASTMKSRRGFAIQRLMNAMRQAHADGWFIVFDTLTLADDRLEAFYDNPNALRDYFRDIGRMVLAAEGRKANDSHADCYQYFCVPEYGTANGRLHFHAVHFMRTLPTGSVDPNFGRRVRNRRQLNSLQNTWPYGYSMPIAVRYTQDAFSRSGWLWPVDAKGEPLKATSYMAVGFYVAKYVNKKSDMDLAAKGLGAKEWNNSLKTKLSLLPKKLFRIRMSRNFGMKMLTMTNLSTECLIQLTKLGYDATPFNQILKQNAKREMRLRLGKVTVADVLAAQPVTTNLLKFMRASI